MGANAPSHEDQRGDDDNHAHLSYADVARLDHLFAFAPTSVPAPRQGGCPFCPPRTAMMGRRF